MTDVDKTGADAMTGARMTVTYPKGSGRVIRTCVASSEHLSPAPQEVQALPPRSPGQSHTSGRMNKLEARWAQTLDARQKLGEVAWWRFEAVTLRLADACRYTPDFLVGLADGTLELHECKGFMRDDARVKMLVCAEMYPCFRVRLVRRPKGVWEETVIGGTR